MPKRVTNLGGIFFKCKNPEAVRQWYADHLGFSTDKYGTTFEMKHIGEPAKTGYNVWNSFPHDTKYFEPATKDFMINLQVEDLEWLLGELKKEGIEQLGETQVHEYGKFAYIIDPEGIKIELWEPVE